MKELDLTKIENEQIKKLFDNFFEVVQCSLEIKDKNRNLPFYKRKPDKDLRSLIENKEVLQSKHFDLFIKNIHALEKNQAYLDTTEWRVLALLSPSLISSQNPSATYEALDYLNQFEFLGENNYSVIKVASIIYSLSQAEPLDAAKMLVRLHYFNLLTEQNLGKISINPQLNSRLFSSVLNKLSLIDGSSHLLTQANLDKLLDNPELNLEMLAKFIQAEDKSKILTQEKFDLAINLKNLLTLENIAKIEKTEVDRIQLLEIFSLLDKANILTQDNFNIIINLKKSDFVDLFQTLSKVNNSDLSQELLSQCMEMYGRIKDFEAQNMIPSNSHEDHSDSLAQRFCAAILRIKVLTKNIFDKIIEFFNSKINFHAEKQVTVKIDLARNPNSLFTPVLSREYPESNAINTNTIVCN